MNYENIKYYDDEKSSEAFQYYFPDQENKGRFLLVILYWNPAYETGFNIDKHQQLLL